MVERPLRPSIKGRLECSKTEESGAGRRLSEQTRSTDQSVWQQQQHEEVMTRLCHCVDTGMGEEKKSRLRASFLDQDTAREG